MVKMYVVKMERVWGTYSVRSLLQSDTVSESALRLEGTRTSSYLAWGDDSPRMRK